MISEKIKKLTDESFDKDTQHGVVLVDFYADWCGPCRMMTPVLEKVADEMKDHVTVAKVDIDHSQKVAGTFRVSSVPTLVLFKEGKEVGRLVGLRDAQTIKDFVKTAH